MTTLQQVTASDQTLARLNENFASVSPAGLYARNPATTAGLTLGYYGGYFGGTSVADGSIALDASEATLYVVADRADGTVSFDTANTDWLNTDDFFRIGIATTGASTITGWVDHREAYAAPVSAGGGAVASVNGATGIVVLDAGDIGITDAGTYFTGTDSEAALQELGASRAAIGETIDDRVAGLLVAGTNITLTYNDGANTLTIDAAGGGGGMTNPMTTAGDLIVGGSSGTPARLGIGTDTHVLTLVSGAPVWAAPSGGGGGSPGGSTTQVQYNSGGSFAGEAAFTYDDSTNTLAVDKINTAKGTDIARATTTDIGAATGNFVHLTGTTTVTGLGTVAAGATRIVRFAGAGTLTHNATSLILPGGASITTAANDCALFVSEGSGNWRCVAYSKANGQSVIAPAAGASLTNFTGSLNTASPNNTVNAARLLVTGGTTNVDGVFSPKGTGALLASLPDGSATGGNKRGDYSVDWQLLRNAASDVASGVYSTIGGGFGNMASNNAGVVVGGYFNQNSGYRSGILGGDTNTITGNWAGVLGGAQHTVAGNYACVTHGQANTADGDYSRVGGRGGSARGILAADVFANQTGTAGDYQDGRYRFRIATVNATPTVATADGGAVIGATTTLGVPVGAAHNFRGMVVAKRAGSADSKHWKFEGAAVNNGGTLALVAAVTPTVIAAAAGASGWSITVTANTSSQAIEVTVTGQSSANINWNVLMETTEVVNA